MNDQIRHDASAEINATANDDFKRSFSSWFWGSITAATVIHFLVFAFMPAMQAEDVSMTNDPMETIEIPDEIEIPPPPEAIARPATPIITDTPIEEDITIPDVTFDANPVENLPPPPDEVETDISAAPMWTTVDIYPTLGNREEMGRLLEREYPPLLRDAGIGGTTKVWFFIDETGKVVKTQINVSSEHQALDEVAIKVADRYVFSPAMNRDKPVPVWISLDITFKTR
jgi:TonB family protein